MTEENENKTPSTSEFHHLSTCHSSSLLDGLNDLRNYKFLLDVTISVNGSKFMAHKVVLAACSSFFRAMFTEPMKESKQKEIDLHGMSEKGIELIIEYAYTSKIRIDIQNVTDVLSAASYCQMESLVNACSTYLESILDLENCTEIASIANLFFLEKLQKKAYRFICINLLEFSKKSDFQRLTWQQFEHILECEYPVNCNESQILQILLNWSRNASIDMKIAQKLFSLIRYEEIKKDHLEKIVRLYGRRFSKVIEDCFSKNPVTKPTPHSLTNSRGMELALIRVGGFGEDGITNAISYFLPSEKKWHNLSVIPHVVQSNYGSAVSNNTLFVVGGLYEVSMKEYIHPFGFKYCPLENKWTTISQMQMDRCDFSLTAVDHYLYAIGGDNEISEESDNLVQVQNSSNCERYNCLTDTWEYILSIPENRSKHAAVECNGCLYVSGGLDHYGVLNSFWRLKRDCTDWEELKSMETPRVDHTMLVIGGKIYVCGGWDEDVENATDNRVLVDSIDEYDIETGVWSFVTKNPSPTFHTGIVAIAKKIYFFGGLKLEDIIFKVASPEVQCFDTETKVWSIEEDFKYPINVCDSTCLAMYVPRCREDQEVTTMLDNSTKFPEYSLTL